MSFASLEKNMSWKLASQNAKPPASHILSNSCSRSSGVASSTDFGMKFSSKPKNESLMRWRIAVVIGLARFGDLGIDAAVARGHAERRVRWNTVRCLACCAISGIAWTPVAPVPMTPTRLAVKSTPSCGHWLVW